jgi:hypothetical protein
MRLDRLAGVELEGFAKDRQGQALDLTALLPDIIRPSGARFAGVTRDLGSDQIELITDPSDDLVVHLKQLLALEAMAKERIPGLEQIHYLPRRQVGVVTDDSFFRSNSRLRALITALGSNVEGGAAALRVQGITDICATHFHFGFTDVLSHEGITAANLLNLVAPAALEFVHERYGMPSYGRNECWTKFARAERLPAPRWFADVEAFRSYFEAIPCLIRPVSQGNGKSDQYIVDLMTPQRVEDGVSEGAIWWTTRIRPKYNTVEWRPLPSLELAQVAEVLPSIDAWLSAALSAIGQRQFGSMEEAVRSGLVPDFYGVPVPASEAKWWERWLSY